MTSLDAWTPWVAIIVTGGPILLAFMSIGYCLYLSRRHLDAIMGALKSCRFIYIWGPAWRNRGWFGGFVLISVIAGIVVWPKADIRYGRLDSTDIENFPPRLKRLLVIYVSMMIITVVWMGVAYLLLKLR
jgi:hypothetical protein